MGWACRHAQRRDQEGGRLYPETRDLFRPADAELFLDGIEHGTDLLHGFLDLLRGLLQGARPEVERLGLHLDDGGIGGVVSSHRDRTAAAADGSSVAKRPSGPLTSV